MPTHPLFRSAIYADQPTRPDEGGWSPMSDPPNGELPPSVKGPDTVALRRCGRCRAMFPGDSTLDPIALAEWWLCSPCRLTLFGPRAAVAAPAARPTIGAHGAR
jgi:hypothetical protein